MSQLKQFDDTIHNDDEYETPQNVFIKLCETYRVFPRLDACADKYNTKVPEYFDKIKDGLRWGWWVDTWCNPPHSKTEAFVRKAHHEWQKQNVNIIMLIPTNTMSSRFWHDCIEGQAEYYAVKGRIRFLQNGKPAKFASRNAYVCVIWRKK